MRIVSGDHLETAKKVAQDVGIITEEDLNKKNDIPIAMTGEEFIQRAGVHVWDVKDENGRITG